MLTVLALQGLAFAQDHFVSSTAELNAAMNNATSTGTSSDYRIWLQPGTYPIAKRDILDDDLELHALVPGSVTIRRATEHRIFHIQGNAKVVFDGITFDANDRFAFEASNNSEVTIRRSTFINGFGDSADRPGYIYANTNAFVTIVESEFQAATSDKEGGHIRQTNGDLNLIDSRFTDGTSPDDGGCVFANGDNLTIDGTVFENCDSDMNGGGLYIGDLDATANIVDSAFLSNSTNTWGGAVYSADPLDVTRTLFCLGTSDTRSTGGLYFDADNNEDLSVSNSIFLNNGSDNDGYGGAAIRVVNGNNGTSVTLQSNTFVQNTAGGWPAIHSALANNADLFVTGSQISDNVSTGGSAIIGTTNGSDATISNNSGDSWSFSGFDSESNNFSQAPGFSAPATNSCNPADVIATNGQAGAHGAGGFDDNDGDGFYAPTDCDDNDFDIKPGAVDICDGVDNDCDFEIDEDAAKTDFYLDEDGDGSGGPITIQACREDGFVVANSDDCNDTDPGAVGNTFYLDFDGDGYGDETDSITACAPTGAYIDVGADDFDCDDTSDVEFPGNPEICDGLDNDCTNGDDDGLPFDLYYTDNDNDGYGDEDDLTPESSCAPVADKVTDNTDCRDSGTLSGQINPGEPERCNDIDFDCDGEPRNGFTLVDYYPDEDGDTFGDPNGTVISDCVMPANYIDDNTDCDDNPSTGDLRYPGNPEVCDGIDNNCDPSENIDEGVTPLFDYYPDADNDGYPTATGGIVDCASTPPPGFIPARGDGAVDCDDSTDLRNPGFAEICDGIDNDCANGEDDDLPLFSFFPDADGDQFPDLSDQVQQCSAVAPIGRILARADGRADCDDTDNNRHPDFAEICDGIDNDCDAANAVDDGLAFVTYFQDLDDDDYPNVSESETTCDGAPTNYIVARQDGEVDCDDTPNGGAARNPGLVELCDSIDHDCDPLNETDNGLPYVDYYSDADGDLFGDEDAPAQSTCDGAPAGTVDNNEDCDDAEQLRNPGVDEECDSVDNNCDGFTDEGLQQYTFYQNLDMDDYPSSISETSCYSTPSSSDFIPAHPSGLVDCRDASIGDDPLASTAYPGATEYCDGIDNDCDTEVDEVGAIATTWYPDTDNDGFGDLNSSGDTTCTPQPNWVANNNDCDDTLGTISPAADDDQCDGVDDDCSGVPDDQAPFTEYFQDGDGDGFASDDINAVSDFSQCGAAANFALERGDCDDGDPTRYPLAEDVTCNAVDNDCDGLVDEDAIDEPVRADLDGDGFDAMSGSAQCPEPEDVISTDDPTFDCDDTTDIVNPDAMILCEDRDRNCNGVTDLEELGDECLEGPTVVAPPPPPTGCGCTTSSSPSPVWLGGLVLGLLGLRRRK